MKSTPPEIEKLLNEYGLSLSGLPKPTLVDFAYENIDLNTASNMALNWQQDADESDDCIDEYYLECAYKAFICHQSDVIELLVSALQMASFRIKELTDGKEERKNS